MNTTKLIGHLELAVLPIVVCAWAVTAFSPVDSWAELYVRGVVSVGAMILVFVMILDIIVRLGPGEK